MAQTPLVRTEHLAGEAWWTRPDACPATARVVKYVERDDVVIGCFHDEPSGKRVNEGRLSRWYANGAVQEQAVYERGKLIEQSRYWESGLPQSKLLWIDRASDRYRLEWFAYADGGIQMSREMRGTQLDGREIRYYSDGKVEQERLWRNGEVVPGSARGYTPTGAPARGELDWGP